MSLAKKLGILVGGGPAPGINSVIAAATIRGRLDGVEVLGIRNGFESIMRGQTDQVLPLTIEDATRIHVRGGAYIGTSRANPTKDPQLLENAITSLQTLGVSELITIGGDDTAFSAMSLEQKAQGRLRVVHVPKTIDNDLDLPMHIDTFGFQTARHVGTDVVKTLMVDAETTSRWYLVIAMGRTAGHLALGIGKSAGAALTLIPEEFSGANVRLQKVVDTLAGAILKRLSEGRHHGVAVVAEGLVLSLDPADLATLDRVERDAHGHVRLAEVNFGEILKDQVRQRLGALGITMPLADKNIGYEVRCCDPIPFDLEYARELGYCAAEYLRSGGNAVMVSMQNGHFVPIPFAEMLDPKTGRARVRRVDVRAMPYAIARRYMTRLRRDDFASPEASAKIAKTAGLTTEEFRRQFAYLVEDEPQNLMLDGGTFVTAAGGR